jgi:hypothetical protein
MAAATTRERADAVGPLGALARVGFGVLLIALEIFWRDPRWQDPLLGLVGIPAVVLGVAYARSRWRPRPVRATGPVGHAVNVGVVVPLLAFPATAGGAFLFYGASMLVAAARRNGGCEVTAISNAVLRRDDQVGCVFFAPVDLVEARLGR